MQNRCERMTGKEPNDPVHVIRHHAPREEPVTLVVEMAQRVRDFFRDGGILQVARARAVVEILFNHWSGKGLNLFSFVGT